MPHRDDKDIRKKEIEKDDFPSHFKCFGMVYKIVFELKRAAHILVDINI